VVKGIIIIEVRVECLKIKLVANQEKQLFSKGFKWGQYQISFDYVHGLSQMSLSKKLHPIQVFQTKLDFVSL
jgi:hypothetical protein